METESYQEKSLVHCEVSGEQRVSNNLQRLKENAF